MQQQQQETIIPIKICTVGDKKVGKTSLIQSYTQTPRQLCLDPRSYRPTVFDFSFSTVKLPVSFPTTNQPNNRSKTSSPANNTPNSREAIFDLNFSDCSSLDCYTPMRFLSYDQCDIFFVCFRLDNAQSFYNAIDKWLPEVKYFCSPSGKQSCKSRIVLLGLGRQEMLNSVEEYSNPFFGQCTSRSLSPELLCGEIIDIVDEQSHPKSGGSRKSLTSVNTKPRSKTYSYRRNYSNPFMKRKRIPIQFDQDDVEFPVLGDSMLDSCLSLVDGEGARQVTWDMIENGRRQLDELGIEHVYYECPFNNQKSVQFIIEECVREFYKCKLSQTYLPGSRSVSLLEKLKRVSL